ncbi:MAG: leucine-rich repeat domain-containing protein [Propylenella sp.]
MVGWSEMRSRWDAVEAARHSNDNIWQMDWTPPADRLAGLVETLLDTRDAALLPNVLIEASRLRAVIARDVPDGCRFYVALAEFVAASEQWPRPRGRPQSRRTTKATQEQQKLSNDLQQMRAANEELQGRFVQSIAAVERQKHEYEQLRRELREVELLVRVVEALQAGRDSASRPGPSFFSNNKFDIEILKDIKLSGRARDIGSLQDDAAETTGWIKLALDIIKDVEIRKAVADALMALVRVSKRLLAKAREIFGDLWRSSQELATFEHLDPEFRILSDDALTRDVLDPAGDEPPRDFDIARILDMLVAGQAPPPEWRPFVRDLTLVGTEIVILAPLASLLNLQALYLQGTAVSDVSPLAGLVHLRRLDLRGTRVSDLSPLAQLVRLRRLYLKGTPATDLTPLSGLVELEWLDFQQMHIVDLAPLANLANLEWLDLQDTWVTDLTPIAHLTKLQGLDIKGTHVADLTPLAGLVDLKRIDLKGTPVTDLTPIAHVETVVLPSGEKTQRGLLQ